MKKISFLILTLSLSSFASTENLEGKLNSLNVPSDKVTPLVSTEKLYIVNQRYSSLDKRFEVSFSGGRNFNSDSHLESRQLSGAGRFHINQRISLGLRYNEFFNELTSAGRRLYDDKELLPDTDFAIKSTEGFVNLHTMYGKLRITSDTVVYFDHYLALGMGNIQLASGETNSYIFDTGFVFWRDKFMSFRTGLKNEFYTQKTRNGNRDVQNMMGYLEFGLLFGGKSS